MSAPERYENAQRAWHHASLELDRAARAMFCEKVLDLYPEAQLVRVGGEYNEDGLMRITITDVIGEHGAVLCTDADPTDLFDQLSDETTEYLIWMGELTGDDYLGRDVIELNGGNA